MDRRPIIKINLCQEDNDDTSIRNFLSLMRGLYTLIEQYLDHNGYPPLDTDEANGRVQDLPLPPPRDGGRDPTNIYFVDITLMGGRQNQRNNGNAPTIRIPLSNDLYITYVEIINPPGSEPRRVNFPGGVEYPTSFNGQMSVLTRHFYQGLDALEGQVRDRQESEYPIEVKYTLFSCVILIAEAARSEYVRSYITQRNSCNFDNREAGRMPEEAWTNLRPFLDWGKRSVPPNPGPELQAFEEEERKRITKLFGSLSQLLAYLARLRYFMKIRKVKKMKITDACKEFKAFDKDRDDNDKDEFPDYKKLDKEINQATKSLQEYDKITDAQKANEKIASTPNEKQVRIEADILLLAEDMDQRQKLFEVMTGKQPETDDAKNRIRDTYSVDLYDEDMQEIAKAYRAETDQSLFDQFKHYAGQGLRLNSVIRRVASQGGKYLVIILNKIRPALIKTLVAKLGAKTAGKIAAKKVPILGIGFGVIFGIGRAIKGDWKGAGMEVASGAAGAIPVVGTAVSGGVDAGIAYRDYLIVQERTEELTNKYSNAVVAICVDISKDEVKMMNLVVEGEFEDLAQWEANPNSRFLKSYDD